MSRDDIVSQLMETYVGDWVKGLRAGKGRCEYADGRVYEGDWDSDLPHGTGQLTFPNGISRVVPLSTYLSSSFACCPGDVYFGGFVKGQQSGHGTLTAGNPASNSGERDGLVTYEGTWVNGKQQVHVTHCHQCTESVA